MEAVGQLRVRVYTSRAQLPVMGATVVVTSRGESGRTKLVSIQTTDSSGTTPPVQLDAPDLSLSEEPGGAAPFSDYALVVEHPEYYLATFEKLQVFPGIETVQNVPLVPLPQPAGGDITAAPVVVTPQPL